MKLPNHVTSYLTLKCPYPAKSPERRDTYKRLSQVRDDKFYRILERVRAEFEDYEQPTSIDVHTYPDGSLKVDPLPKTSELHGDTEALGRLSPKWSPSLRQKLINADKRRMAGQLLRTTLKEVELSVEQERTLKLLCEEDEEYHSHRPQLPKGVASHRGLYRVRVKRGGGTVYDNSFPLLEEAVTAYRLNCRL